MKQVHLHIVPQYHYYVLNGVLYRYRYFGEYPTTNEYLWNIEKNSDLMFDTNGLVLKDRENVNIDVVVETIQQVITGYNQEYLPMAYVEISNESLKYFTETYIKNERHKIKQQKRVYKNA